MPPDADWQLAAGPRYLGDESEDRTSYGMDVGLSDADGTLGILVGTPNAARPYARSYPWHDGAFLLGAPYEGGVIPEVAEGTFEGFSEAVGQNMGAAVALIGDVTGDAAPDAAVFGWYPDRTYVTVYAGPLEGSRGIEAAAASLSMSDFDTIGGGTALFGGDLNGDGQSDLLVNAASVSSGALVYFGPLAGDRLFEEWDIQLAAPIAENAGLPLVATDQDGDGLTDVVLSAFNHAEKTGRVYLASAPPPGLTDLHEADAIWEGEAQGGEAGMSLASGDLDGDGAADLFVGAPLLNERTGRGYAVLDAEGGSLADAPLTFEPRHELDFYAFSATIADFDGDGQDDLAVGAPRDPYFGFDRPGRVAVFRGPLAPGSYTEDLADVIWIGSEAPDTFGARVLAGDLDADGQDDLVVGAPWDPSAGYQAGSVTILFGGGL